MSAQTLHRAAHDVKFLQHWYMYIRGLCGGDVKPRVYLFLDVDGVLHSATPGMRGITGESSRTLSLGEYEVPAALRGLWTADDDPPFNCLPVLMAALRPYLDQLEIVITSSWRTEPELYDAILKAMSPDMRARVAGATPRRGGRPYEINQWLREHAAKDARAIVLDDDDRHAWHRLTRRAILLLTVHERGFTEEDGRCLARLLSMDRPAFDALRAALPVICRADALIKQLESVK